MCVKKSYLLSFSHEAKQSVYGETDIRVGGLADNQTKGMQLASNIVRYLLDACQARDHNLRPNVGPFVTDFLLNSVYMKFYPLIIKDTRKCWG